MAKLTDQDALSAQPASGDLFHVVDVSDTTDNAAGSSKKITYNNLIPDASETVKGKVELATTAETETGTDATRAVTPDGLHDMTSLAGAAWFKDEDNMASNSAVTVPSQQSVKAYVDTQMATVPTNVTPPNLIKNGNFINNSTNGYGSTPDDWTSSNANPVQGGIPALTKQNLIDILGVTDSDIEGLWNLNGDFNDLSSNAYHLTPSGSPTDTSDGLMAQAKDFESSSTQYASNTSPANTVVAGSQTWIAFIKAESISAAAVDRVFGRSIAAGTGQANLLFESTVLKFQLQGLTTNTEVASDIKVQTGKWYMIAGVYDSANSKLKIWCNGIKKEVTASGSATTAGTYNLSVGRSGAYAGDYYDGVAQNCIMLSTALTDTQVKKLFAATMYAGQKIRRATTNAYLYQQLPQDLVERLRGKTVAIRADMYQAVASTGQISIHQTMADGTTDETIISATDATTGSWLTKSATGTLEADVTTIEIRLKHSTTDGNTWFRRVSIYEGSTSLPYDHSKDDWSRFPKLLQMKFPHIYSGYQYEQNRIFSNPFTQSMRASGSMTVSSYSQLNSQFIYLGENINFSHACSFTNGGVASVANYLTLPFSIYSGVVSNSDGIGLPVQNNSTQESGIALASSKNELVIYRYTGGNWSLTANQRIRIAGAVFPIDTN